MNDETLLTTLEAKVKEEQRITAEVIRLLADVNRRKLHARRGYDSLQDFCMRRLNYSKGAAWRRCSVVFLMRVDETVADKVESGELNITNAVTVSTVLRAADAKGIAVPEKEILAAAYDTSTRKAEKRVEELAIQYGVREKPDQDLNEKLDRLCALLSHKHPGLSREKLLHLLADEALAKHDPEKRKADPKAGGEKYQETRYAHPQLKNYIFQRDKTCTYINPLTGKRCGATHFLELDHIVPFSRGGLTKASNLRLLCRTHNQLRNPNPVRRRTEAQPSRERSPSQKAPRVD